MSKLQVYDGSKWVNPSKVSYWDGTKWVTPQVKVYDGTKWGDNILEKKVVKTWDATWNESYDGNNNVSYGNVRRGQMAQGKYGYYDPTLDITHNPIYWGRQRSLVGFNVQDIQNSLSGARIEKVELYLHIDHSWYYSGATAAIGAHGFSSKPTKFDNVHYNLKEVPFNGRDEGKWIEFSTQIGQEFASGKVGGFSLYRESDSQQYYGFWHGTSGGAKAPKLRITYWTNEDTGKAQEPNTPKNPPQYTTVRAGEGLVQVIERLMVAGLLGTDFFANRDLIMRLNGFNTSNPILQIGQQIMYKASS